MDETITVFYAVRVVSYLRCRRRGWRMDCNSNAHNSWAVVTIEKAAKRTAAFSR